MTSLTDVARPKLPIIWEKGLELPVFRAAGGSHGLRPGTVDRSAFDRRAAAAARARCCGWRPSPGEHGYERFPYLLDGASGPGHGAAFPLSRDLGILRFVLPLARGSGLLRRALAEGRNRRAARSRMALLRAGYARTIAYLEEADRRLPPRRHSGLRLARTAARKRELLERPSGVAREDRPSARRPARLAQAHESDQSAIASGRWRQVSSNCSAGSIGTA